MTTLKVVKCAGQDHQIKSIYLDNRIYTANSRRKNSKVWLSAFRKGLPRIRRMFWRIQCRRSRAAVVLLRKQANQSQSCLQGIFMGVLDDDASFGPSVRLLRWLKGFLLCSRLTHVKLKATLHSHYITYHLGPPSRIHMVFRGIWGHVILQLAQWSGVSAPCSSLSLCALRLTRSNSIKVWGF